MTMTRTFPTELLVLDDGDSRAKPVSAVNDPIERRIAAEMTATLHDWLRQLPAPSLGRRRGNGPI
ncbi:hypothetical protein [Salinibacterium sp. TMP30]|uniref:hypothetical protein n=1 Tax=Salinibacterium sp. TMP30 TaxID=3138237 RepID=UPI003139DE94